MFVSLCVLVFACANSSNYQDDCHGQQLGKQL